MSWQDIIKQRKPLGNPANWSGNKPRTRLGADKPRTRLGTQTVKIEWEDIGTVEGDLKFNIQNSGNKTWAEIATSLREMNHIGAVREVAAKRHPKANEVASGSLFIGKDLQ
tara:strand:- start:37 stop:369 length:333 start_codon:yes stop_codon:yes gene_type:complete